MRNLAALLLARPLQPLTARRYTVEVRQQPGWRWQAFVLACGVLAGVAVSAAILVAAGVPAGALVDEFIAHTLFDLPSLQSVVFQAAPMMMIGLAASIAFRARFWNLGLEGQMIWGAIGATAVSLHEIGPPALRLPLMLAVSAALGLAWAWLPAWLKLRLAINEIISSLMLNYVASNFLLQLVYGPWKDPTDGFPHSAEFRHSERLPDWFGSGGSAIVIALVLVALMAWLLGISRAGFYLRFIHASERVAHALGVPVRRMVLASVLASGSLAGMAGFVVATGQEGRLTQAFYQGYGFSGILIAFLARNNPLAASVVALLIAMLFVAGRNLQVFYQIPFPMVQLIQAIIVICVASADFFIRHRLRRQAGKAS